MKNLLTNVAKRKTTKRNKKSTGFGTKVKSAWNNNKSAVGSTVKSTLVVGAGTFIGLAASKMLGRK